MPKATSTQYPVLENIRKIKKDLKKTVRLKWVQYVKRIS
tara:strand:+ start:1131 stop:1247 length:117 start_codon:yes stop_codon:yes gene_type:complete